MIIFPKNFFWGTATSSHQVEGDNIHNDWWDAEQKGLLPKSGKACDSYNRYEEDFDLAKAMHNNAHRFSIEWSRIEPEEGKFDEKELKHYYNVIQALHARGITPLVTLHHFTNPKWFADRGGWENKKAPEYFARYAEYMASNLGHEVKYWLTINEPLINIEHGYLKKTRPPFHKKDWLGMWRVLVNLTRAHIKAYEAVHKARPDTLVGIVENNNYIEAPGLGKIVLPFIRYFRNFWFFDRIKDKVDFFGLNYYKHFKFSLARGFYQEGKERSDMGWEIYPEGIYHVVKDLYARYKKPIYITENGIADADDDQRPEFIKNHLLWLYKAIEEGADVRGYFYWSLLDNYEWQDGFSQRFGLVEVNFDTFERKMRPSGKLYNEISQNNGL